MNFESIYNHECTNCFLYKFARTVCIGGRGASSDIKIIIVGEAPGPDENKLGMPFVGKSGQLLDELLEAAGVDTTHVRWENIVRCWPQKDSKTRPPSKTEIEACIPYFYQVLERILESNNITGQSSPLIVALGNTALEALTGKGAITRNRGIVMPLLVPKNLQDKYGHLADKFNVLGTIHPSAVLRGQEHFRPKIVDDFRIAWMEVTGSIPDYAVDYEWISDRLVFSKWVDTVIARYESGDIIEIAADLETTGLNMYDSNSRIVAVALCADPGKSIVLPIFHKDAPWLNDSITIDQIIQDIRRLLETVPVVGWNYKFDLKWFWIKWRIKMKRIAFDGMLSHHWIYGETRPHDLNTTAATDLNFYGHGRSMDSSLKTLPKADRHMGNVDKKILLAYAGGDADATLQICRILRVKLIEWNMLENYLALMVDGIEPMAEMEMNGVAVNPSTTKYLEDYYPKKLEPLVRSIEESAWGQATADALSKREKPLSFSVGSTETLQELLFSQMKLPVIERSEKTNAPSVDKETLNILLELLEEFPHLSPEKRKILGRDGMHSLETLYTAYTNVREVEIFSEHKNTLGTILEWRKLSKQYSTYVKKMPIHTMADGFFHTTYNISGTATGRHSSSDPSLHTIPKGSDVRWQFISRWRNKGGVIIAADMSQAEMRVAASLSEDANLIEAITGGIDMHTANAMKLFNVPQIKVTKHLRNIAKTAGFGVLYGISAQRLAATTGISLKEAEKVIADFFSTFSGITAWMKTMYDQAKEMGFVVTPFGRIRWINGIERSRWGDAAWRKVVNTPIQSTASDVTYLALLEVIKELKVRGCKSTPFGFIHDSILIDTYPGEWWTVVTVLREKMMDWTNGIHEWLRVPMIAEFEICPGWGFPCDLSFDENMMIAEAPPVNISRLKAELKALGWTHIIAESKSKDKDGKDKVKIEFSMAASVGTPDFRLGKSLELF